VPLLHRCLPRRFRIAVRKQHSTVGAAQRPWLRRLAGNLHQRVAPAAQPLDGLSEQHRDELPAGNLVLCGHFGQAIDQHLQGTRFLDLGECRDSLVADGAGHTLAGQQRHVNQPVFDVVVLALDAEELVGRETAQLVFDGAGRLIEQDARRRRLCCGASRSVGTKRRVRHTGTESGLTRPCGAGGERDLFTRPLR
jgi:hypothetical protein